MAPEEIVEQLEEALERHASGGIDWITFVGSGETSLHADLGLLIRRVKAMTKLPVAVITNGSLLFHHEIRDELSAADAVLPSLDAGTPWLYRRINRPHPCLSFERHVEGLKLFRAAYQGKLWLELMLLGGVNDSEEALVDLATVVGRIRPDELHLDLPTRPPAEPWVRPPDGEGLARATAILGEAARVVPAVEGSFDLGGHDEVIDAVVGVISRHPMSQDELERTLARWPPGRVGEALEELWASGRAQVVERHGSRFWAAAGLLYGGE